MRKTGTIFILLSLYFFTAHAQHSAGKHQSVKYCTQAQVIDSTEGVLIYQKLMKVLALDYELLSESGSTVKGWNEEYYDNGQLMHISYYKEGRLVLFKNYYTNGQCENNITYTDSNTCNIEVYFENGSLKFQLNYHNGFPKKLTEFFASGLPKCNIEYDSDRMCVISKRNWFLNAEIQTELQLIDPQEKKYSEKSYYPNGQLRQSGELTYLPQLREYVKSGTWQSFESSGKKGSSEKFKIKLSSN